VNVYIYANAAGGAAIAQGTTQNAGGMLANSFPVTVTVGAAALHAGTIYHLAVGNAGARRSPATFLGVQGGVHNFAAH
jgi:hypothetical protein